MSQEQEKKPTVFRRALDLDLSETTTSPADFEQLRVQSEERKFEASVEEETRLRLNVERAARELRNSIERRAGVNKLCPHGIPITANAQWRGRTMNYLPCMLCTRVGYLSDEQVATLGKVRNTDEEK